MAYIGQAPANKVVSASDLEDGIITNSKLAQDIISAETELATAPADTDELLISDAGTLKRIDASLIGGGGITEADMYRLTADSNDSDAFPLTNWERVDDASFAKIGTGISVSSGIFSFPSTGLYLVSAVLSMVQNNQNNNLVILRATTDNFSSNDDVISQQTYGAINSGNNYNSMTLESFFNCTNVSTHKVKVHVGMSSSQDIRGDTNFNESYIKFIRLGDSQ